MAKTKKLIVNATIETNFTIKENVNLEYWDGAGEDERRIYVKRLLMEYFEDNLEDIVSDALTLKQVKYY